MRNVVMVGMEVEEVMDPKVTRVRTEMMQIVSQMELTGVLVATVAIKFYSETNFNYSHN